MAYKELYWHSDRNDVPIGDGPLLVRDTRAYQQYTRARDVAHVLQILRTTRDPAVYEHAGDAPVTLYFVIERITDEGRRAVLKRNLAWITRFLAREAGEAVEAVDAESMLVLSGSKRGKALYHVLVPSLYIADEDARTGLSRALRAYKQLEASDVDAEAYGRCAMLRTIWSSEFGARCVVRPIEDSEFRPDDEAYLIHNIRADARPLRLSAQLAKPIPTAVAEAVEAVEDAGDNIPTPPETMRMLRAWVEENYVHVALHEKDSGTKLQLLFNAYTSAVPPVHTLPLGKIGFSKMLASIYAGVGPHRNTASTASGIYLLRSKNTVCDALPVDTPSA
jgi:hypothetical protein